MTEPTDQTPADPVPDYPPELPALMKQVEAGDTAAIPALRALLAAHPDLLTRLGDLAAHAERGLIDLAAAGSPAAAAAVRCHLDALRAELATEADSPLERVLVGRVVLSWVAVHQAEVARAESLAGGTSESVRQAADRRVDRAHARLGSAAKCLATVRKLSRAARSPLDALLGGAAVVKPGAANRLRDVHPVGVN